MWKYVNVWVLHDIFLPTHGRPNIRFHRSMTRPFFYKERITDFDVFDRHARDALDQAATRIADGYPVDFQVQVVVVRSLVPLS